MDRTGQVWEHIDAIFIVVAEPTRSSTLSNEGSYTASEPILFHPIAHLDADADAPLLTFAAERPGSPWEVQPVMTRIA